MAAVGRQFWSFLLDRLQESRKGARRQRFVDKGQLVRGGVECIEEALVVVVFLCEDGGEVDVAGCAAARCGRVSVYIVAQRPIEV